MLIHATKTTSVATPPSTWSIGWRRQSAMANSPASTQNRNANISAGCSPYACDVAMNSAKRSGSAPFRLATSSNHVFRSLSAAVSSAPILPARPRDTKPRIGNARKIAVATGSLPGVRNVVTQPHWYRVVKSRLSPTSTGQRFL